MASGDPPTDYASDEDASLTSTSDEALSQDEWAVRRVLAEARVQGQTKYLIDWDGFDLCDATWEPAAHLSEGLLADWLAIKKKTGKKIVPGFKINEWRQAVSDDIRAKFARHMQRNQRRARLGLELSEINCTLEEWISSVQGPSEDELTEENQESP
ncbi:chromo domain-containing protein [Metarhizium rileyi]|uniref:Chromo domain-containing protein n=1 Tax=Metarhizium rileyi (strain RCEF 4871) TaxID=1649241 RepID=A0A167ES60_METRR|nr:chromo domain-containing protein [Metarhizium rileyi RCEF 4871]